MSDPSCAGRYPPPRQVRGTRLNTIVEDSREAQYSEQKYSNNTSNEVQQAASNPPLKLKTSGFPSADAKFSRLLSPMSACSMSTSCSDTEWQRQMQGLDELYDATDDESDMSDECMSFSSTRPSSLVTPTTRNSMPSPASRNRYPTLTIPPSNTWPSMHGAHKSSPILPTPPPKIPVSPAALSLLTHSVPAPYAPPSLDGSVSSDQVSNISAPATPDLQSVPDHEWNAHEIHVPDLEESENGDVSNPDGSDDIRDIQIAIESTEEDWRHVLGNFPRAPSGENRSSPSLSLDLDAEPVREHTPSDRGVYLSEDAMAMLQHIPLNGTPDPWSETSSNDEMWQVETPERPRSADDATPASAMSGYSFSSLSIPSPGGFFASLNPRARHTWSIPGGNQPPSSAVAQNFYNLPFSRDEGEIVEQVVELPERSSEEQEQLTAVYAPEGPRTAIRIPPEMPRFIQHPDSPTSEADDVVNEIPRAPVSYEYDEHYGEELQQRAMASLDRTSVWLAAQESYLSALRETNPVNLIEDESDVTNAVDESPPRVSSELTRKKSIRFNEAIPAAISSRPSPLASRDSIYWRGFQSVRKRSGRRESFLHRDMRFDAVQSNRLGLTKLHAKCLMGNYELLRPERPPYNGPFSQAPRKSIVASVLEEKAQFLTVEKEQMVLAQIYQPVWAIDALKYLNGGGLIASPASKLLSKFDAPKNTPQGTKRHVRVLDLGGHASCEWAWDLAHDYPNAKVYTAYTPQQTVNHGIKGPPNHRRVSVTHLWKLPFPDNKFDVISARSLPALLKAECPVGKDNDEYDLCLKECYRCLKPGGYLEFLVMDAEVSHAGPYASATSVEFRFNLKSRGYDPIPSKRFLPRLLKQHFVGTKRAWFFLPMGVEPVKRSPPRETPEPRVKSHISECEAVHGPVGSTGDVASMTGLLGGWVWEQWLLKLQVEMGRDQDRLLEGIGAVFDEGRKTGAGWTCLSGWTMKPRRKKQVGFQQNLKA